jgi:hypothetical protein
LVEFALDGDSILISFSAGVAFVVAEHPKLMNLSDDEAHHFSKPLILVFVS